MHATVLWQEIIIKSVVGYLDEWAVISNRNRSDMKKQYVSEIKGEETNFTPSQAKGIVGVLQKHTHLGRS